RKVLDAHRATRRRPIPVEAVPEGGGEAPAPPDPALGGGGGGGGRRGGVGAAGQRAGCRDAALRDRPRLRRDRRRDRLLRGSRAPERARRPGRRAERVGPMNMDTHELARRAAEEGLLDVAYTTVD